MEQLRRLERIRHDNLVPLADAVLHSNPFGFSELQRPDQEIGTQRRLSVRAPSLITLNLDSISTSLRNVHKVME